MIEHNVWKFLFCIMIHSKWEITKYNISKQIIYKFLQQNVCHFFFVMRDYKKKTS